MKWLVSFTVKASRNRKRIEQGEQGSASLSAAWDNQRAYSRGKLKRDDTPKEVIDI
jgi:hypothetical protein